MASPCASRLLAPYYRKGVTFNQKKKKKIFNPFFFLLPHPSLPPSPKGKKRQGVEGSGIEKKERRRYMSRSAVIIIINRYQTCCLHLGCFRGLCIHKHSQTMWRQLDPLSLYTRASSSSSSYLSPRSSRCTHTQTSTSAHAGVQPTVRRHRSVCETGPFLTGSTQPQNKKYKFFLSFFLGSAAQKQHLTRTCAPRVKKVKTCWYDDDTPSSSTEMRSLSAPVDTCKTRRRLSFCCKERHRRKRSGAGRDDNARPQTTTGLLLLLYFGLRPKRRRRNDFQVRVINTPAAAAAVVTCRSLARQYVIYTREPKSFFLSCKRKKKNKIK